MGLVQSQFAKVPNSGTLCIPGAGIGTYVVAALEAGFKPENITAVEIDRASFEMGSAIYRRFGVNYILADFMTWEPDVKFDVIAGNPPYSDRSKVSGANTGGCSNNLDSDFFIRSMEIADRVSLIIRAKHFMKSSSKFRKKLFSSGNLMSIKYIPAEIFPTVQNTQTCVVTWDKNYNGPCKITYKDGTIVDKNLTEKDLVKLDNLNFIDQVPNNLAHRYSNGNLYRNAIKDISDGAPIVEILGAGDTPKVRYIEPGLEETGRNKHGVIMNMAAEWGGLGKVMIKPYEASVTFSVVFLETETSEEATILKDYLMSDMVKEAVKVNMASFHPTKDLFRKIADPLI
jgi:predicted RNA methylase